MRRTALLTSLLVLALAPASEAASRIVVKGAGFGHGIGMSQYGAYGFAQKGFTHERILKHYYRGTTLTDAPSKPVRVLLQASDPYVRFRGATRGPGGRALDRTKTYRVTRSGRGLRIRGVGTFKSPLRVKGATIRLMGPAINGVRNGVYRSGFEFRPGSAGGVNAVNALPLDPYVQGVVAGEMPSDWDLAALRAQAVTARTYALATRKTSGTFDLYPDTRSQVYRGVRGETSRSNRAVKDTAKKILTYKGKPAVTYYFSTSGGETENIELSFLGAPPKPWLKSVEDPYDDISPRHRWTVRFTPSRIGARLGSPGGFRSIKVLKRGNSPRIVRARVTGSRGSRILTGAQIRARLGLYDSWARFTKVSTSQVKGARASANDGRVAARQLAGVFDPAPRSRILLVERRVRGAWTLAGRVTTSAGGRYRAALTAKGVYRVRSGAVAGPAVRVR